MHEFTDSKGRVWTLRLTLAAAQRIDACDFSEITPDAVSFLEPTPEFFEAILKRTSLQFAIIWCIIEPQARALGISQEDFCEAIDGDCLLPAKTALWEEIVDFFPELKTSLSLLMRTHQAAMQKIDSRLAAAGELLSEAMDREIDQAMEALENALAAKPGTTSIGSPPGPG